MEYDFFPKQLYYLLILCTFSRFAETGFGETGFGESGFGESGFGESRLNPSYRRKTVAGVVFCDICYNKCTENWRWMTTAQRLKAMESYTFHNNHVPIIH